MLSPHPYLILYLSKVLKSWKPFHYPYDFVNSNFATLFASPDAYKDSTIDVTAKVANFPEVGLLQMYIEGAVPHDAVVHYNASFGFVEGDCVKVTGIVEQQFYGTNVFSAKRIVPSISARSIDKIDCTQATLVTLPVAFFEIMGWDIKITKVIQDNKTNQTTSIFNGLFAIDSQYQPGVKSGINYKINGIFQEPSGLFQFIGKETRYY